MKSDTLTASEARQRLYEVIRQDVSFDEKARGALELGQQYLGVDNGHLTRIDTETDHWEVLVSTDPPDGRFPVGLELDLGETYCRRTIATDEPIAVHDAPTQGWDDDPAFDAHGLSCYYGTTIFLDGDLYGTVCFVAVESRQEPFQDDETMFVELIAQLLERELERYHHEAELTRRTNLATVLNRVLRHNLRNEMSVIRGQTWLMADQLQNDALGSIALNKIDQVMDLCQKAREIEQIVGTETERVQTDIVALTERVVSDLTSDFPDASITVDANDDVTAGVLPSFERAIRELIENAAKHGGETPTITVTVENVPNGTEIRIADDGSGLPDHERKVLETGAETPLIHGSGLGLWLVHWIVTSHNGTVEATVTDGGTTMAVSVPRSPAADDRAGLTELWQAHDQYHAAFENAFDGQLIIDDDARIIDANPAAASIYGMSRSNLRGRTIQEFLPEEFDFEAAWANFQTRGNERDTVTIEGADGVDRQVEYSATTDIVPGQHLIIIRDITDRLERERELVQAETVFENTQDAVFLIDVTNERDFRIERVNEVYEELTGLTNEEIQGKTPREVVGDDIGREIEERYRDCVECRETIEYPEEIPVDGELRYWKTKLTPVIEAGQVVKLVGAMRDVTDQKEQQRNLRAERERFERLLDTSPVGIAILDRTGTIVRANERAETMLGLSKSKIIDRQYDSPEWNIVDANERPIPPEELPFRRVIKTGKPVYEYEHGIKNADGSLRWLSINAAPLTASDGTVERVITAITDITRPEGDEIQVDGVVQE